MAGYRISCGQSAGKSDLFRTSFRCGHNAKFPTLRVRAMRKHTAAQQWAPGLITLMGRGMTRPYQTRYGSTTTVPVIRGCSEQKYS